jgi:hypothetical protein
MLGFMMSAMWGQAAFARRNLHSEVSSGLLNKKLASAEKLDRKYAARKKRADGRKGEVLFLATEQFFSVMLRSSLPEDIVK